MTSTSKRQRSPADYTIACICPMGIELAPVECMLDEIHEPLPVNRAQNVYTLGRIDGHNIVIAVLPEIGTNAAGTVATQLLNDFPSIRFGLLVGIGGGVPGDADIRLGDVVVSKATDTSGGVVQYDLGKRLDGGSFQRTGLLNKPPHVLSASVQKLESQHRRLGNQISALLTEMIQKNPDMRNYAFPGTQYDRLFLPSYSHQNGTTCDKCDQQQTVPRSSRPGNEPQIHYGIIGSANTVVRDAVVREELRRDVNVLCVEMEAAGLMDSFPCVVIRGICDYADSHKNKHWQPYAAAVAAAYMKELLLIIPVQQVVQTQYAARNTTSEFQLGLNLADAPLIDSDLFFGRLSELNAMSSALNPDVPLKEQRRLVLGGAGGIGKTQLAIAYARKYSSFYTSVLWLDATSELVLKKSFRSIALRILEVEEYERLNDEQVALRILKWLSDVNNSRWLLIFDNYDEPESSSLQTYYPPTSHGTILITSRLPDRINAQELSVRKLTHVDDGVRILETRSRRPNLKEDVDARKLVERLGGFPLALATVGAHLRHTTWTCGQYLQEYEERWNVDPERPVRLLDYQNRTMYTTWDVSYAHIESENATAAKFLKLLAYFDNQNLWYELFCDKRNLTSRKPAHEIETVMKPQFGTGIEEGGQEWLIEIVDNRSKFENIMRVLAEYHLLEVQLNAREYSMHSCIHDWIFAGLNKEVDSWNYWYAIGCVARLNEERESDSFDFLEQVRLAQHAIWLMNDKLRGAGMKITKHNVEDAREIACLLYEQSQYEASAALTSQMLAYFEKTFGRDHESTMAAVGLLGLVYNRQGKHANAETVCMEVLTWSENELGSHDDITLITLESLADVYTSQGRLDQAGNIYSQVMARREELLDPDDLSTLVTVRSLGDLRYKQDRLDEAESLYLQVLAGHEKLLGREHFLILSVVHQLGNLYDRRGKFDKAYNMFSREVKGREKVQGEEHGSTLKSCESLGHICWQQGNFDEAEKLYQRVLAGKEKVLGRDHKRTLDTVRTLGSLHCDQGKLGQAEAMYIRALENFEKTLGEEDESVLSTVNSLGDLYQNQGKLEQAEEMYTRAWTGVQKLGDESTLTFNTVWRFGDLYRSQGQMEKAERAYMRAMIGFEKLLGKEHRTTLNAVHDLGRLYRYQGRLEKAESMYMRVLDGYQKNPRDIESFYKLIEELGSVYFDQGNLEEARKMYMRALNGLEHIFGEHHFLTLSTVCGLGVLSWVEGNLEYAEAMFARALFKWEEVLTWKHPSTLAAATSLAVVYSVRKRFSEAQQISSRVLVNCQAILNSTASPDISIVRNYAAALALSVKISSNELSTSKHHLFNLIRHFRQWRNLSVAEWLAKAFLALKDEENAQLIFFHLVGCRQSETLDLAGVSCDGCHRRMNSDMGLHVCRQCIDMNLCDSCLSRYKTKALTLFKCCDHTYCDFGTAIQHALKSSGGPDKTETDAWIEQLIQNYSDK